MFVKWSSFAAPKTKLVNQNLFDLDVIQIMLQKQRTLNERSAEGPLENINTAKNHLDQCEGVQHLLNLTSLGPNLFSDIGNIRPTDRYQTNIRLTSYSTVLFSCNWSSWCTSINNELLKINNDHIVAAIFLQFHDYSGLDKVASHWYRILIAIPFVLYLLHCIIWWWLCC